MATFAAQIVCCFLFFGKVSRSSQGKSKKWASG
jgi:hypothetical protein